jgi:hypothetical protein
MKDITIEEDQEHEDVKHGTDEERHTQGQRRRSNAGIKKTSYC